MGQVDRREAAVFTATLQLKVLQTDNPEHRLRFEREASERSPRATAAANRLPVPKAIGMSI
jgi:hypothetical protein